MLTSLPLLLFSLSAVAPSSWSLKAERTVFKSPPDTEPERRRRPRGAGGASERPVFSAAHKETGASMLIHSCRRCWKVTWGKSRLAQRWDSSIGPDERRRRRRANTTQPGGEILRRPSPPAGELLMGDITPVFSRR